MQKVLVKSRHEIWKVLGQGGGGYRLGFNKPNVVWAEVMRCCQDALTVQAWGAEQRPPSGGGQPVCGQRGHLVCWQGEPWTFCV